MSQTPTEKPQSTLLLRPLGDEMKSAFMEYAMSVIVSRALPDVRDGLKPVQRRIMYAMYESGILHNKAYRKSAETVGEVMGKYHPHGDTSIYDAMVRMAQDFSLRYTLVDGQGNFGSIDGDPPAAMRYTEARLRKLAEEALEDINKETVNFIANYADSRQEPTVLPSKVPNLLINGSTGIAVGMATNIPPHNLSEVCDAAIALIDNPDIDILELAQHIHGPDFPTKGIICGRSGILNAYSSGKGRIVMKGKTHFEENGGKKYIIITEIPYMVNKSLLIQEIAEGVKTGRIENISDIRDESARQGMRVVIILKQNADEHVVLNQLMKYSRLKTAFNANMLALVGKEPKRLNLKDFLHLFVEHRKEVVTRRTQYDLKQAQDKAHKLEGLVIALDNIDAIVALIRAAASSDIARDELMSQYAMSDVQAKHVLDMRLSRLTSLEQDKIRSELAETKALIAALEKLLADISLIYAEIRKELVDIKERYGDERQTVINDAEEEDMLDEDLIEDESMVVTITHSGYIKRVPLSEYKAQRRGGVGVRAATTKEDDVLKDLFFAKNLDTLLCFTSTGKVHWVKVYKIPEGSRQSKGRAIINILPFEKDETLATIIPVRDFEQDAYLIKATKKGTVKKTALSSYANPRRGGIIALGLDDDDQLVDVRLTEEGDNILLATKKGMAVRFAQEEVRAMGRSARGVRGISLGKGDELVSMGIVSDKDVLLSISDKGYGKRTACSEYRLTHRGGKGIINMRLTEKNGEIVYTRPVVATDDIMIITKKGIIIRCSVKDISVIGRSTQGVRVMRMKDESDRIVAVTKIEADDEEVDPEAPSVNDNTDNNDKDTVVDAKNTEKTQEQE